MRPSPSGSGLTQRLLPETITVSDDDEEPPMALVKRQAEAEKLATEAVSKPEVTSKLTEIASTSLGCSSKDAEPFVPYREPESQNDVLISSASTSSSFMPAFFTARNDVKQEPEALKNDTDAPIKLDDKMSAKVIKKEPKDEVNVEVGDNEKVEALVDVGAAEDVKREAVEQPSPMNIEECANLLLSLAASVSTEQQEDHHHQDQEELDVGDVQSGAFEDINLDSYFNGLDVLLEGIQVHTKREQIVVVESSNYVLSFDGLEMLSAVTQSDAWSCGVAGVIDLSVLCAASEQDYMDILNWVDPLIELKSRYNLHSYKYENSQALCRQFIAAKMKKFKKLNEMSRENERCLPPPDFESLDAVVNRIKNMEIMSQLEVELRSRLAQLQDLYRDKQKAMSRLKSSPKKIGSAMKSKSRGPGRPKKRCLKMSTKTKMGRPRKQRHSDDVNDETGDESDNNDDDDDYEEEDEANLSPPVLQPWSTSSRSPSPPSLFEQIETKKARTSRTAASSSQIVASSSGLLKPPKLTASFSPQQQQQQQSTTSTSTSSSSTMTATLVGAKKFGVSSSSNSVTNLSMLNAKFMKGKANPFQNLMKLASAPSSNAKTEEDQHNEQSSSSTEEEDDDEEESKTTPKSKEVSTEMRSGVDRKKDSNESERKLSDHEDGSASKRRKSEKPKRHFGSTETIVHKQPKNLFMMNCMNLQRGFSDKSGAASKADEYDFRENDDDEDDEFEFDASEDVEDGRWTTKKSFLQFRDSNQGRQSATPPLPASASTKPKPVAWSPTVITKPQTSSKPTSTTNTSSSVRSTNMFSHFSRWVESLICTLR